MSDLIKFSIDKLEIIEFANKSQFAKARVDFFASGNNAHNMPVKEETLRKYADTILGKPLIYIIEKGWFKKEDFGGHDPLEVPMGFFTENEKIGFRQTEDGRTVVSAIALIWKKYADKAMQIFSRDGLQKPVSVEMQLFKTEPDELGRKEIIDFAFTGCTVLGGDIKPAVKDAYIEILEFSAAKNDYEEKMKKYASIDFSIPKHIKDNIGHVLNFIKKTDKPLSPSVLIKAEHIINNDFISPEDVQDFVQFFSKHKDDESFFLCGGEDTKSWLVKVSTEIEQADKIDFSETETKEDEKMTVENEDIKIDEGVEFSDDANVEVLASIVQLAKETEDEKEAVEEEKEEVFEKEEVKEEETEEEKKEADMAKPEEDAEMSALKEALFALKDKLTSLEEETKALREFKASVEENNKNAKIEFALSEVSDIMPKDKIDEWREKSTTVDFASIDVWANAVKADAFTYVKQNGISNKESITRMALPNNEKKSNVKKSLWAD